MTNNKNSIQMRRLSNCTFVKTILMLTVVIYHCILFWTGTWFTKNPEYESGILATISSWLNSFHIYGFTLVSGYLFYHLKQEKHKYSGFIPFVFNKVKRLLIPYVFVSAIWAVPFAIYFSKLSFQDIISQYVLGIAPSQLWFLLMLFFVFIIFYPLADFFEKNTMGGAVSVIIFYGVGIVGQMLLPNVFQIFSACTYISLFWVGFKLCQYRIDFKNITVTILIFADLLLFAVVNYISKFDGIIFSLFKIGINFILHIVGALMAFAVLQKIADLIKWNDSKLFKGLSRNSMPVYLFHQQFIYLFIIWFNGILNPYLHATVNFIGALSASLLLSYLLMKFKLTRFLIGEKSSYNS